MADPRILTIEELSRLYQETFDRDPDELGLLWYEDSYQLMLNALITGVPVEVPNLQPGMVTSKKPPNWGLS